LNAKKRKKKISAPQPMEDADLLRYSRHILLNELGIEGQQRILDGRVLLVGAGGLGSPVALYLGSAGVGQITVVDDDTVDLTNLQRQVAHTEARVGLPKVLSIQCAIAALNSGVCVNPVQARADATLLHTLVAQADVVVDCCDNFKTRHAINAACVQHRVPLVSGAAVRFDGQVAVYDPRDEQSPCYACVFPPDAGFEETLCATMGVFAPLVGLVGSMQAAEVLKLLSQAGRPLTGRLLMIDGRSMELTELKLGRRINCSVCGVKT
jgi:molybdopterin/thiamine biosynthesis adenylyltransferase